jgi:DNA-binding ferritin-like protein
MSILQAINQLGYDPRKIVSEIARLKSLRQTERHLKNNCKILESHLNQFKDVLPLCEQIARLGIGFPELMMFQSAAGTLPRS